MTEEDQTQETAPEQKQKKPRKPRSPRKEHSLGWFLETYEVEKGEDGKNQLKFPPMLFELDKTKNMKDAMKQFEALSEADPEKVANKYCRFIEVHKIFRTQAKTTVEVLD